MEARRVLKDSGKLIITMIPPKFAHFWQKFRGSWKEEHSELLMKKGQIYGMTERELTKLLNDAGFEVEINRKFNFGVNNLTIAKKSK